MKYRCIKPFSVPYCDGDGFEIENKDFIVEKDSIWETSDDSIIGGEVHLDNDKFGWLEISNEDLAEYFEPVEDGDSDA